MTQKFDIAVVGSGAAGIAAAVSAGRCGCSTLLLDQKPEAGGTGGFSGLTTLCGLYDDEGNMLNNGFTKEVAESLRETNPLQMGRVWVLPYRPARFREVAQRQQRQALGIVGARIVRQHVLRQTKLLDRLTDQERRILDLIGDGLTNRQIAEAMFLAEKTVKNYVSNLLTKMGMARRGQVGREPCLP